jgi:hypothetical protein
LGTLKLISITANAQFLKLFSWIKENTEIKQVGKIKRVNSLSQFKKKKNKQQDHPPTCRNKQINH